MSEWALPWWAAVLLALFVGGWLFLLAAVIYADWQERRDTPTTD